MQGQIQLFSQQCAVIQGKHDYWTFIKIYNGWQVLMECTRGKLIGKGL